MNPAGEAGDAAFAVRDQQNGFRAEVTVDHVEQLLLVHRVQIGGGFVEDDDIAVAQQLAGERQPQPFPDGKIGSALENPAGQAVRLMAEKLVGPGGP